MINKSNIILIVIGAFLSAQFTFFKAFGFIRPFHHWHWHEHWVSNSLGFTSLIGVILIFLGLYNIYKDNKIKKNT
ncbi:MAG: hypothetical protein NTU73_13875 [Ignavibacteriae bacterium]|nr:hypothetical protein [Ignavibacteriota bacterium]